MKGKLIEINEELIKNPGIIKLKVRYCAALNVLENIYRNITSLEGRGEGI